MKIEINNFEEKSKLITNEILLYKNESTDKISLIEKNIKKIIETVQNQSINVSILYK